MSVSFTLTVHFAFGKVVTSIDPGLWYITNFCSLFSCKWKSLFRLWVLTWFNLYMKVINPRRLTFKNYICKNVLLMPLQESLTQFYLTNLHWIKRNSKFIYSHFEVCIKLTTGLFNFFIITWNLADLWQINFSSDPITAQPMHQI